MALHFLLLSLGLIGLWIGSDRIVEAGKSIALRLGVSQLVVGLTIVSLGTSLPEIMVSIFSGVRGADDIAVGSMIGSCLAQITLILGISGIIHNIKVRPKALHVDGNMLLASIMLFAFFLWTGMRLTPLEGLILISIYIGYLWYTTTHDEMKKEVHERATHQHKGLPLWVRFLEISFGIGILIYSADLVLDHATFIARANGLSEAFIGVMIVGTATGLPELSTAVVGVLKKAPGISIGTLIGSNITDPLFSLGIGAVIGGGFVTNPDLLAYDVPFWLISSTIALLLLHSNRLTLNKFEGASLILVYVIFVMTKLFVL